MCVDFFSWFICQWKWNEIFPLSSFVQIISLCHYISTSKLCQLAEMSGKKAWSRYCSWFLQSTQQCTKIMPTILITDIWVMSLVVKKWQHIFFIFSLSRLPLLHVRSHFECSSFHSHIYSRKICFYKSFGSSSLHTSSAR